MKLNKVLKTIFSLTIFSTFLLGLNQNASANEIVKLSGDIQLKRNGEADFQPANFLDSLNYEDEFKVNANSLVVIRCRSSYQARIEQPGEYKVDQYCPEGEVTEVIDNNNTFRPPTEDLSQTPYIISPRNSSIFSDQITIKWNRVSEATEYIVKIEGWEVETTNTEIVYTGEVLTPGFYFLSVEADNGESSGDVGFSIIDRQQAQLIQAEAAKIKQERLEAEAEKFILARFYQDNNLHMSAIEILEDLVAAGSQAKNVYLLLADLYDKVGLESEAYELNQQAMKLGNI